MLYREHVTINAIIVVSPYGIKRARQLIKQRGKHEILNSFKRLYKAGIKKEPDPIDSYMNYHEIHYLSISEWCKKNNVPRVSVKSLNDNSTISFIRSNQPDWIIYGGGGILKDPLISIMNGKILNAHSGPLPEIRGMNACEWSILLGYNPAVTIHLINKGIDTGGIIKKYPVPRVHGDSIDTLRSKCVVEGIRGLVETILEPPSYLPEPDPSASFYRQCYVMAPALRELLKKRLAENKRI